MFKTKLSFARYANINILVFMTINVSNCLFKLTPIKKKSWAKPCLKNTLGRMLYMLTQRYALTQRYD